MTKDFSNFSFGNCVKLFFLQIFFAFSQKSFLFHKKMGEYNLQPFIVIVKGSEKNDPNLRNGILDKCVTPFIL